MTVFRNSSLRIRLGGLRLFGLSSRMNVRDLFSLLCLFLLPLTNASDRPNILWLSAEDISPHFGCYGDKYAITPHVDALAEEGTVFTHAYTTAGVCAPSRSAIILGMYQNSVGTHHMRCDADLADGIRPFPLYLREAGYYCTNNAKTDYQFSSPSPKEIWNENSRKAHWKNRGDDQPFFAVFNFVECHESYIALDPRYQQAIEKLPAELHRDPFKRFTNLPPYYPDTQIVHNDWRRNYEMISGLDVWVGEHIRQLEEAGLADNTIVMFWSDHGVGLPRAKRWLYESGTNVPLVVHVPERFRGLVNWEVAAKDGRIVSGVDFGPTVLELAGLPVPEIMQGQSFTRGGREFAFGARDRMDERYDIIRMVRGAEYRYIRNFEPLKPYYQFMNTPEQGATMQEIRRLELEGGMTAEQALFSADRKPVEELYHVSSDPHEVNNLASNPEHAETLARMRAELAAWQNEVGDIGLIPESEIKREEVRGTKRYDILRSREGGGAGFASRLTKIAAAASLGVGSRDSLLDGLADAEPAVRFWGATGLGNLHEDKAFSGFTTDESTALLGALADKAPAVRIAAARALAPVPKYRELALERLAEDLKAQNEWARLEAAIVLDELDEIVRPKVADLQDALIDQPNKYIVRVANRALNELLGTSNTVK